MQQKTFLRLCACADAETIEEAIKAGASPTKPAHMKGATVSPLFVAVMENNPEAVKVLIRNGADYVEGLMTSVLADNRKIAKLLVDCGADINAQDKEFHNPLLCAVNENKYRAVKWVIELGADVNVKMGGLYNALTYSVLMFSTKGSTIDKRIIRALMKAGSEYGEAIMLALKVGSTGFIDQLIKNGADINKKWPDKIGYSPLGAVMLSREENIISPSMIRFLAKRGADVNEIFDLDQTATANPLNISISINRPDIAKILLHYGADPNYKDKRGRTPLFYSVLTGNKITKLLLTKGADPNVQDKDGRTPLMLAVIDSEDDGEIMKTLLDHGTDPNIRDKTGLTALIWAVVNKERTFEYIMEGWIRTGGTRAKGFETWITISYLYAAAKREIQLNMIKLLIKNGADINIQDARGMNAITYSMSMKDNEITKILIKAGSSD